MVASATTSTSAAARNTLRGGLARIGRPVASISEGIFGDQEPADDSGEEAGGDERQPLLDERADRLAEMAQQFRLEKEARAARDERQHDEHEEVIAGETRGDGDDLVGDRRHALDEDDPRPPFGISRAEGLDALAIA